MNFQVSTSFCFMARRRERVLKVCGSERMVVMVSVLKVLLWAWLRERDSSTPKELMNRNIMRWCGSLAGSA